jgi:alkanesulfonate monooxygenase SsuD/methylene tetrahydromethanopterin reductase-like flavin-dependent oxidoreductase (luciferase family)
LRIGFYVTGSASSAHPDLVEQAQYADRAGFHSVWLRERHFHRDQHGRNFFSSPMVVAAYLAARTSRVRIGLGARILPLDHPLHVAEAAATIDVLSDGRLDLGVARIGENELYEHGFGRTREQARRRFEESIEVLVGALSGEPFTYAGDYFRIPRVAMRPRPIQRPHPPLFLVGISPDTLAFGAARGMPLLLAAAQPVPGVADTLRRYRALLAEAGHEPDTIPLPLNRFLYVGESDELAIEQTRRAVRGFLDRPASVIRDFLGVAPEDLSEELIYEQVFIAGSPQTCRARIEELHSRYELSDLICTFNYFTIDHDLCRRSMELFAEQVLPVISSDVATPAPAGA